MPRRHPADTTTHTQLTARHCLVGFAAGVVALAALVAGSAFGSISSTKLDPRLIAWISAGVLLVSGAFAATRLSACLGRVVSRRSLPSAGSAVRIVTAAVGYLIVVFGVLAVLKVSIERLLVGAGLAGIVLGIAATQSLGNIFAGMVLILTRPFGIGDHIRVRSGALGGVFDAWVIEMSLTYTTVRLEDGQWKIPNSAMLAAGIGQLPRTGTAPPLPQVPGASVPVGVAPAPPASPGPPVPTGSPASPASPTPPDAPVAIRAATPSGAVPETVPRPSRRRRPFRS